MTYIDLINAFERWLETNYLPISSQLLWYKIIGLFNKCGWSEWVTVDNHRLMSIMQMKNEKTFIKCRDYLIESKLFFYKKGKKNSPNQYKINTVNFTTNSAVNVTVNSTVNVTDINRLDKDNYLFLFNKYKEQFSYEQSLEEKMEIFKKCMQEEIYKNLSEQEQTKLYTELISKM